MVPIPPYCRCCQICATCCAPYPTTHTVFLTTPGTSPCGRAATGNVPNEGFVCTAHSSKLELWCRDAKDAFAAVSDDEQDTAIMPGALKAGQKTKRFQQRDPGLLQAEQILKAGSHAINLYQDQLRQ